ncbi:unnamed protein product [Cylicocyclus nassatus]|uniref:Ectonucleotide pyrophosphatase/phosphodiesterase family member 3 n=1 Tax=Cylicocyclus nassatus TaxID=53992 RepID=A0AA36GRA1_CYLNA|nr:unnamed protein product [Cylicocyclus nassatus]
MGVQPEHGGKPAASASSHIKGILYGAILIILILALIAVSVWLVALLNKAEEIGCSLVCRKPSLLQPHPPLVVISLDGFAHKYLAQKIQPTLDRIAECGVSAMVFPSFPSATFPNHVTMSNGLFPGRHGIVSNSIYDLNLSSEPVYLGTSFADGYYVKEPIWSIYQRETKRHAAAISWIGTYHNTTYYQQPHYVVPFDPKMSADEKFDKVVEYLKLDDDERPGLIMAYNTEPDATGHQASGEKVYEQVRSVDKSIDRLLGKLKKEGMLGCVNIVVVSDHGLSVIKNHVVLDEVLDTHGFVIIPGVNTLMFRNGSNLTDQQIVSSLTCKGTDHIRVFDKRTLPVRFHFSESKRIGDFVILGHKASTSYLHRSDIKPEHVGNHGFDFVDPDMFTIMFARGPSFKQGTVLPNFMNVEYMNLWTKLLQLSAQENDGDPDFMNLALVSGGGAPKKQHFPVRVCKATDNYITNSLVTTCGNCTDADKQAFKTRVICEDGGLFKSMIVTSDDQSFCYLSECNEMAIIDSTSGNANVATLIEMYDGNNNEQLLDSQCTFHLMERTNHCANTSSSENVKHRTLSAFPGRVLASNEQSLVIPWKTKFIKDVLDSLNEYTKNIVKIFGKVVSITGTAFDEDYDGRYSTSELNSTTPTHLYRILLACDGDWSLNGAYCQKPEQTKVMSFIFPHMDGDPNCLDKKQLLLQYTARVKDVEILSGLHFNFTSLSDKQQMLLKLHVNTELW